MRLDLARECGAAKIGHVCFLSDPMQSPRSQEFIIVHPFPSKVFLGLFLQVIFSQSTEVLIGAKCSAQSMLGFLRLPFGLISSWLNRSTLLRPSTSTLSPVRLWGHDVIQSIQYLFKTCYSQKCVYNIQETLVPESFSQRGFNALPK